MDDVVLKGKKLLTEMNPNFKRSSKYTGVKKNGTNIWYSVMDIDTFRCYLGNHQDE